MARDPSLLHSNQPSAIAPAAPVIAHVQLRDLLICPREQGVLNYVVPRGIVEQDLNTPKAPVRVLSNLTFTPNSLTSLQVDHDTLIAAGGQDTELHLSYHTPSSSSSSHRTRLLWEFEDNLTGSINNSVLLTALSLTRSNESSVDPRVGISNNDGSVRLYDIPLRVSSPKRKLHQVGQVKLDVPINHSSISPDGRTLLSVGDSNKVYIHQITGGASISFASITTLTIPPPDASPLPYASSSLAAAFSTAFSGDGTKFAVASQEGVVAVWDVRSTKPVKVFQTDKTRGMSGSGGAGSGGLLGNGGASGWLSDDPFEWTRGTKAPGWCVRSVKFNGGEGARLGKEVMAFTEHTSLVHLVDARTFETHDIIRVPALQRQESTSNPPRRAPSSNASTSTRRPTSSSSRRTSNTAGTASSGSSNSSNTMTAGTAGTSLSGRPLSRAELFESALADHQANPTASSSRSLIRRLLPVSNARRSGLSASSSPTRSGTGASARPARTFAPPQSAAVHRANREAARAAMRSRINAQMEFTPTHELGSHAASSSSSSSTPGGIAASLPPASAARLTAAAAAVRGGTLAGRRSVSVSAASSSATPHASATSSAITTSGSRTASSSGTPAIVQALGDAFRIPVPASAYSAPASIGDSTWRTLGGAPGWSLNRLNATSGASSVSGTMGGNADATANTDAGGMSGIGMGEAGPSTARYRPSEPGTYDERMDDGDAEVGEGIVVVPDLGDRDVESEVHALLAVHGIQSRLGGREGPPLRHSTDPGSVTGDSADSSAAETHFHGHDLRPLYDLYMQLDEAQAGEDDDGDIDIEEEEQRESSVERALGMEEDHQAWFLRALASLHDFGGELHQNLIADPEAADEDGRDEGYDDRDEDRMRVDEEGDEAREDLDGRDDAQDEDEELEFECASRGSNSRSGSPFASSSSIRSASGTSPLAHPSSFSTSRRYGSYGNSTLGTPPWASPSLSGTGADPRQLPLSASSSASSYAKHPAARGCGDMKYAYYEDLDIAGLCFDPLGERMYVAGVGMGAGGAGVGATGYGVHGQSGMFGFSGAGHGHGFGVGHTGDGAGVGAVVEWSVRGAEKRWWVDDGWM